MLIKSASKKARQKNIETEIAAGKELRQAVGEAYGIQREALKKKQKKGKK